MCAQFPDWLEPLALIHKVDTEQLFSDLYGIDAPKSVLRAFSSKSLVNVLWSDVRRRPIYWLGVRVIDLTPMLRVNIGLFLPQVPVYVRRMTILEELIHLQLGWDKGNYHDEEFYEWALKCDDFLVSMMWKEQNALRVIGLLQSGRLSKERWAEWELV